MPAEYILNSKVLVLNKSFKPVNVTIVKDAIGLIYTGSALIVVHQDLFDNYGHIICNKYDNLSYKQWVKVSQSIENTYNQFIHSRVRHFKPKIIKLTNWNGKANYYIRLSKSGVFNRDKGICQYCGKKLDRYNFTVDHIIPKMNGGQTQWNNIVCCCKECNNKKDDQTLEELGWKLLNKPVKPTIANFNTIYDKEYKVFQEFMGEY